MPTVERSIQIHRRPQEVWPWATRPDRVELWLPATTAVTSGDTGEVVAGHHWTYVQRFLGMSLTSRAEVVDVEAPRRMRQRATDAPFAWTSDAQIEPHDAGCVFSLRIDAPEGLGGIFAFADSLVVRRYGAMLETGLHTLKELVEATPSSSPTRRTSSSRMA